MSDAVQHLSNAYDEPNSLSDLVSELLLCATPSDVTTGGEAVPTDVREAQLSGLGGCGFKSSN